MGIFQGLSYIIHQLLDDLNSFHLIPLHQPYSTKGLNGTEFVLLEVPVASRHEKEAFWVRVTAEVPLWYHHKGYPWPELNDWASRVLAGIRRTLKLNYLIGLKCYTPDGYCIGRLEEAIFAYSYLGLTKVQSVQKGLSKQQAIESEQWCNVGFDPETQEWVGWGVAGLKRFGIGYKAAVNSPETFSGWTESYLKCHPHKDLSVPVGFQVKTLEDAKRCAIAFADSCGLH